MTQLVEISARAFESRALELSRPSVLYVHLEAFGACRVQMRIMQQFAQMVEDRIDLFVLDDLNGNEFLAQHGVTHAPVLMFHKERVLCVIEGITPIETLVAVIKSHFGVNLKSRKAGRERSLAPAKKVMLSNIRSRALVRMDRSWGSHFSVR